MSSKNFLNFFFNITPTCSHNVKLLTSKALGKTACQEVARDSSGATLNEMKVTDFYFDLYLIISKRYTFCTKN